MEGAGDSGGRQPATALEAFRDDLTLRDCAPGPGDARGVSQKVISGKAFCPAFMAALSRVAPGGEFPAPTHDYVHVFYVAEGTGAFSVNGRELRAGPGTGVRVPPEVAHGYRNPGPGELLLLAINSPATR